jgi:hypothetical protein
VKGKYYSGESYQSRRRMCFRGSKFRHCSCTGIRINGLLFYVAEALHTAIPLSELVIVPGVGHDISMEAPEIFNIEARRFINRIVQKLAGDI